MLSMFRDGVFVEVVGVVGSGNVICVGNIICGCGDGVIVLFRFLGKKYHFF